MNFKQVSTHTLALVLVALIASVDYHISVPAFFYGQVNQTVVEAESVRPVPLRPAVFAQVEELTDSIIFVGDVLLARNVEFLMGKHGADYPYRGINFSDIARNPYVVGNFESSVPQVHIPTEALQINFSVDSDFLPSAKKAGFTHLSLANNHSYDYGEKNYLHTISQLNNTGFKTIGHPKELSRDSVSFINLNETKVAIIGVHALEKRPTESEISRILKYSSLRSSFQVVYIHWGAEYNSKSNIEQQTLAKEFVAAGADLIVGHHPHVVQEVSLIDGVPVFYSLGNYIFDQYSNAAVQDGLLLSVDLSRDPLISLVPVTSQLKLSQPTNMKIKQQQQFLLALAKQSDPELRAYIENGFVPLHMSVATSSKVAIMSR